MILKIEKIKIEVPGIFVKSPGLFEFIVLYR
jgi:hypothetical protein